MTFKSKPFGFYTTLKTFFKSLNNILSKKNGSIPELGQNCGWLEKYCPDEYFR